VFGGTPCETRLYRRDVLGAGTSVSGPCIVLEEGCTTLVPPGWTASVTAEGHLVLMREQA
jgi:N-methylhydantoinase A